MTAVAERPDLEPGLDEPDLDPRAARAARARAALARAEERTGTAGWVRPVRRRTEALVRHRPTTSSPVLAPAGPGGDASPGGADLRAALRPVASPDGVPAHVVDADAARADEVPLDEVPLDPEAAARLLPVAPGLGALLPLGALQRGSTVVAAGSTSLVLGLLAEASRAGSWVALVGLPGVGVLAAHELGIALERVVLVPEPGADGPTVVAALLDGVDVVVVGPATALGDGDRRRLSARARERSSVLVPTTPWPGAHVVLTATAEEWQGLGRGHGRLRSRRLVVDRQGRGSAARPVRAEVVLPADAGAPGGSATTATDGVATSVVGAAGGTAPTRTRDAGAAGGGVAARGAGHGVPGDLGAPGTPAPLRSGVAGHLAAGHRTVDLLDVLAGDDASADDALADVRRAG